MELNYLIKPKPIDSINIQKATKGLGKYKVCPVCHKKFYMAPTCSENTWAYKVKDKPACSWGCSRKDKG